MADQSTLTVAVNIFASPNEAFAAIRERTRFWFPLLLILVGLFAVTFIYTNGVDILWSTEQQIRASDPDLTDAQIEQVVAATASIPQTALAVIGAAATVLVVLVIYLLYALYLKIVSAVLKDGILYKQWFGLVAWCSMPALLSSLATLVNLLANDITLMPQTEINPLSFVNLFGLDMESAGTVDQIVANLDITSAWALILTILGYRAWTGKNLALAAFIVTAPYILIVGLAFAA